MHFVQSYPICCSPDSLAAEPRFPSTGGTAMRRFAYHRHAHVIISLSCPPHAQVANGAGGAQLRGRRHGGTCAENEA